MLSDLPMDLAEEVVSRIPVTSLRGVRTTCKKWKTLCKDGSFTRRHIRREEAKKKQRKEFEVVMMLDYRVSLFRVNLLLYPFIERVCKLISLDDADRIDISNIFHCYGLLLCITKDLSRLVVWNPCSGQTLSLQPRNSFNKSDKYALGYDMNNKHHKVLRFLDHHDWHRSPHLREFEVYNLYSNSWKVLDVNPDWDVDGFHHGFSLHGNTYWFARDKKPLGDHSYFLLCFDFTTETFGPRLRLPFHPFYRDTVCLSSVGENQLAVLFQRISPPFTLRIWITSKIEPNAVSWNKLFLKVDMKPITGFPFCCMTGSFFVDKKKKVAVVVDKDRDAFTPTRNIAYIIGNKGSLKKVELGESTHQDCWPLVCSYVPSSVQINQKTP